MGDSNFLDSKFLPERREFTPERREKERELVREAQKAIKKSKYFSKEEKIKEIKAWEEYFVMYMHEYTRYHESQLRKIVYQELNILN
jgi:hypothetical protein